MTGRMRLFRQGKQEKLAAPLEQKLFHRGVLGQTNRPVEGIESLSCFPQLLQQVSANRPIRLISADIVSVDSIQRCQTRLRSVCLGYGRGISGLCAERGRDPD